jgi:hypothetical protein
MEKYWTIEMLIAMIRYDANCPLLNYKKDNLVENTVLIIFDGLKVIILQSPKIQI